MSRQEAEPSTRQRQRANTASFAPFSWRKTRTEQPPPPAVPPAQPVLSLQGLIDALTPPSVPSLAHARALATTLSNYSPLPRRELLNPILVALCDAESPSSVQAAGFDILSAYWENHEAPSLGTPERLSYFSLFLGSNTSWAMDLWEPRFKALRALTKDGVEIIGVESNVIDTLQWWINGAFDGLIKPPSSIDRSERAEHERSIELIAKFLEDILLKDEIKARIMDEKMAKILHFYSGLVDRAISSPDVPREPPPMTPTATSTNSTPSIKQSIAGHRRNLSSLSSSSGPSTSSQPDPSPPRSPADFATTLFLNHVTAHIKFFPPIHLSVILPVLFRALAFCAAPLPRLSIMLQSRKKNNLEDKITEMLSSILSGPYSATSMLVLRQHLFPSTPPQPSRIAIMTSIGAHRTLRNHVRRALSARLARAYISRETSMGYSYSGAPVHMELQVDLMEKAWPKDDYTASSVGVGGNGWDAGRLGKALAESVGAWIKHEFDDANVKSEEEKRVAWEKEREGKDEILEEAAGILKDILQELDLREEDSGAMDEDEAHIVGLTLLQLSGYVLHLKNQDGLPFIIPIGHPSNAPTAILRTISSLLARDYSRALNPLLSGILIHVAEHLTDTDTSRLPVLMMEQQDLSPTSPEWLDSWRGLLDNPTLVAPDRPLTRRAMMDALQSVYVSVKDMTQYRRPLGDLVAKFCGGVAAQGDDADVMWKMLGEEIVLRRAEYDEDDPASGAELTSFLDLLIKVASEQPPEEEEGESSLETSSINTADTHAPLGGAASTLVSPTLSQLHTDTSVVSPHREKEKDSALPSVISILTSLAAGGSSSRSQSMNPHPQDGIKEPDASSQRDETQLVSRDVSAVAALVETFCQLTFTPFSLQAKNLRLAVRVYDMLLGVLAKSKSNRARVTALQFFMRLRADRDHRLYFVSEAYDPNGLTYSLASLIGRVGDADQRTPGNDRGGTMEEPTSPESVNIRKARARFPHERDGRQLSGARGAGGPSRSGPSRSRSRAPQPLAAPPTPPKPVERLWHIPETTSLPFYVSGPDSPSEVLVSYDPDGPDRILVLPVSAYLQTIVAILERETSWEVLSYVLCHLPVQLANKHLFCGPNSRAAISKMLPIICTGILSGELGGAVESWPPGLKARDAHGLAYQTLSVLISYRRCFDLQQCHLLVEVFQAGLNGQLSTIKCCLHALSLSAFELQPSMTKCLSRILEKLSQIMSNPNMAVHILGFLSIIGSLPSLHVNFTEGDFKMVFGVALQYLQHYNRLHASPTMTMSWALSQHVRILSYSAVYIWFLAVKLPDRPRHIRYIARQLLLANEGEEQVDGPTEVCFDWLSRYTYASADPRPAHSTFSDIVLSSSDSAPANQKTWILGHSIVTIRTLPRSGWVEVMSRRPSGLSRFICRIENVPMVGPGDVAPDLLSVPAGLILERDPSRLTLNVEGEGLENGDPTKEQGHELTRVADGAGDDPPAPDPITGYVWSGTAPSQRRKQVEIDPSFLILQLSPIPDGATRPYVRRVPDSVALPRFVTSLDRIPVIDTHKVGIMYVAPGQCEESEILRNVHGSPAYTRFLEGIGRLINLRGQMDVYAGGLEPDEDGEYAYAWWDDIGQILYHTATMMPTTEYDLQCNNKKRHIGNDYVRIVWNDSGLPYRFDTLSTQFQFVNIVIEPHSLGSIAAFSNNIHENEYFKVIVQLAPGMTEFAPIGHFKLISAENLPLLVRQLSLLADWFASVFAHTQHDTLRVEMKTNWHARLEAIRRFKSQLPPEEPPADLGDGVMGQEALRDFTTSF